MASLNPIACILFLLPTGGGAYPTLESAEAAIRDPASFPVAWNRRPVKVAAAELENLQPNAKIPQHAIPFGDRQSEWQAFKSRLSEDSQLWFWQSPDYPPKNGAGRLYLRGYCIVQKGVVVAIFCAGVFLECAGCNEPVETTGMVSAP